MSKHVTGNLSIQVHAYISVNRFGSLKELNNFVSTWKDAYRAVKSWYGMSECEFELYWILHMAHVFHLIL